MNNENESIELATINPFLALIEFLRLSKKPFDTYEDKEFNTLTGHEYFLIYPSVDNPKCIISYNPLAPNYLSLAGENFISLNKLKYFLPIETHLTTDEVYDRICEDEYENYSTDEMLKKYCKNFIDKFTKTYKYKENENEEDLF